MRQSNQTLTPKAHFVNCTKHGDQMVIELSSLDDLPDSAFQPQTTSRIFEQIQESTDKDTQLTICINDSETSQTYTTSAGALPIPKKMLN